jgi:hypothetical protein
MGFPGAGLTPANRLLNCHLKGHRSGFYLFRAAGRDFSP